MENPRILSFAGSTRQDSYNKELAKIAMQCAEKYGAEVTFADLREFQMPLYCGDTHTEQGIPDTALAFKELMRDHHGFLIASPEYNGSLTGTLKNTIDWATIKADGEERMACFDGKVAGIMCAAPGMGGSRGLHHLRMVLSSLGSFVLPRHLCVTNCHAQLHDGRNTLSDDSLQHQLDELASELVRVIRGLH